MIPSNPRILRKVLPWLMGSLFAMVLIGCGQKPDTQAAEEADSESGPPQAEKIQPQVEAVAQLPIDLASKWSEMDDPSADGWSSEALSDRAGKQLKKLGALFFEDGDPSALLAPGFATTELVPAPQDPVYQDDLVSVERLSETEAGQLEPSLDAVRSQLAGESSSHHFKFKIIRVEGKGDKVSTEQLFSLSYPTENAIIEIHARWDVEWLAEGEELKLASIRVTDFERSTTKTGGQPLFADVTASAIGANDCYAEQLLYGMNHWLARLPVRAMLNRFGTPGIAVGDVDGDGLDDLYLCQEPGLPNRLFLQNADGSAREVAAEFGVDWIEDSRAALLVDLDNDGDQDLVVAIYGNVVVARNEGGARFEVAAVLPTSGSTASLASADYDNDGRLDLFVCAYVLEDGGASMGAAGERFIYHDAENGAPNSLFHNDGGFKFSDVTASSGIDANNRRWSFAASWEDYDDDGDQDLYVANDYGRNNLYRNDGGKFSDVAAVANVEDSASGMSAAWGDYNRDGSMDIYVSNMFSAAGSRVTALEKFKSGVSTEIRDRFRRFARGNTLFRNAADGSFEDVTLDAGVYLGRWAWGSNFVDLNNDSWDDLVVANGYLSSPASDGDL